MASATKSHCGDYTYGQTELQKIFVFLDKNGYTMENVKKSYTKDGYVMQGVMDVVFNKDIKYSDKQGNYVNDRDIKVTVSVDSDFDWKHSYVDEDGDFEFSTENQDKVIDFAEKLSKNNYSKKSKKVHGGRKNKTRKSQ